ncbi:MAG TPA: LysM peptidoglycan-binding domain-containing protein [Planctomycetota bacterium]|nr:LysM peptidoglycan-binding domain-containing protein [Planctomycetota bacterium]
MPPEKVAVLIITGLIAVLLSVTVLKSDASETSDARLAEELESRRMPESRRDLTMEEIRRGEGRTKPPPRESPRSTSEVVIPSGDDLPEFVVHPMASGETPGLLAARYYGKESLYQQILKANPEITNPARIPTGYPMRIPLRFVRDPELLRKGQKQDAPTSDPAPVAPAKGQWHVVKSGETLSSLAKRYLGKESAWPSIRDANRDTLKDPAHLKLGSRLLIPSAR